MVENRQIGIKPLIGRWKKKMPEIGDKGVAKKPKVNQDSAISDAEKGKVLRREWLSVSKSSDFKIMVM